MNNLPWLLLLMALAGWWYWSLQARERAIQLCVKLCGRYEVQLLDQTVSLAKMRLVREVGVFYIERHYVFDFSGDGESRQQGRLVLRGMACIFADMPGYCDNLILPV